LLGAYGNLFGKVEHDALLERNKTLVASPPVPMGNGASCFDSKVKPWGFCFQTPAGWGDNPPWTPAIIFAKLYFPMR